jgi:hypothetical protein
VPRVTGCADALQALGEVEWASRAPLVQAIGLVGEHAVALLCERNAVSARDLAYQALSLSEVSASLPAAAQARRSFELLAAAAEAVFEVPSEQARSLLEQGVADSRFPAVKLIAAFGLACACERAGDKERAAQLRGLLRELAPHCAPLHADLATWGPAAPASQGPVSQVVALGVTAPAGQGPQARAAQRTLLRVAVRLLGLWLLLMALFFAFYTYLSEQG